MSDGEESHITTTLPTSSKQQSGGLQLSAGTNGASASGNYSPSKINANYASVGEQSGIFSGDDGYNININDKTTLNGAVISSSQKAVDEGKANFKTSSLEMSDIQNRADYSANGFGISASVSNSNHGNQNAPKELGTSKTIGYGSDSDSQTSIIKSGIITSDKESEYAGKLANNFDKNEVQNEIDTNVRVTQAFDATRQSVKQEINKEIDEANKVLINPEVSQSDKDKANDKIAEMQEVGLIVDMVNGALYNPSDTLAGTAVNTLSPKIVYEIGQHFKENEELNKLDGGNRDEQGSTRHLLAQALVAGVTAGVAGNDALTSALSAGGAEALAPKLASVLYGIDEKDVSKMTAEQKQTISAIISLASTAIGAGSGSVTDMVASGEAGRVAVEENAGARATPVNRYQQQLNENAKAIIARNENNPKFRYSFISRNNNFTERDIEILEKADAEANGRFYIRTLTREEITEAFKDTEEIQNRNITEVMDENGNVSTVRAKKIPASLFRGGNEVTARVDTDIEINNGFVNTLNRKGKPQGLSVNINPHDKNIQKYGGAFPVNSLPNGLVAIQSGKVGHHVIAPARPMTLDEYQQLLNKIDLGKFNKLP